MDKKIIYFEVSSPEELKEALSDKTRFKGARFAVVRVYGPHILTRQFLFPETSERDLINGLRQEASETLSISARDMEIAYQTVGTDNLGVRGVYSAMSRALLMEYLDCFKSSHLIPVSLTASAIGVPLEVINSQSSSFGPDYFVVNFLREDSIGITGFADHKPTIFREAYDLSEADFEDKIRDTIRYACGHSASKMINKVFFTGRIEGKDNLIKKIKSLEQEGAELPADPSIKPLSFKAPNLLSQYVLDGAGRSTSVGALTMVCSACIVALVLLSGKLLQERSILDKAGRGINVSDYQTALALQEQLKRMGYAK